MLYSCFAFPSLFCLFYKLNNTLSILSGCFSIQVLHPLKCVPSFLKGSLKDPAFEECTHFCPYGNQMGRSSLRNISLLRRPDKNFVVIFVAFQVRRKSGCGKKLVVGVYVVPWRFGKERWGCVGRCIRHHWLIYELIGGFMCIVLTFY